MAIIDTILKNQSQKLTENKGGVIKGPTEAVQQTTQKTACKTCFQEPDLWVEYPCAYRDRWLVRCGVCGKFIGYRLKPDTDAAAAGTSGKTPGRSSGIRGGGSGRGRGKKGKASTEVNNGPYRSLI